MFVIKIILWVLLGLLGLLLLLLVIPASASVRFEEEEFYLSVRYLFLKFRIFPPKEKKQKNNDKDAEDKKEDEKQSPKKEKKKKTLPELLHFVNKIVSSASSGLQFLLKFLWIRRVELVVPVHAEDAGDTAVQFGQVQALIGGTRAVLDNIFNISYKMLQVYPDFSGQYAAGIYFSCKIVASPVIMLATAFVAFKRYLTYDRSLRQFVFRPVSGGQRPTKKGAPAPRKDKTTQKE